MEYTTDRLFLHDDDVKEGDWDLAVVIVGMYVDGTCIDDIDAASLGVHFSGESTIVVVIEDCFDVVGNVLESSARVESRDSVLDVAVTTPDFSIDVTLTYVTVDESVFVVDGKKEVFVTADRVVEVVGVPVV